MASGNGYLDVVKLLLANGASVDNARTDEGCTPLFIASNFGHADIVKLLLAHGADVNKAMHDGDTPLIRSSFCGHLEIVRSLVEMGANLALLHTNGYSAKDMAKAKGHSHIVTFLSDAAKSIHFNAKTALASGEFDLAIAILSQVIPPTRCQNAMYLTHRAVAICVLAISTLPGGMPPIWSIVQLFGKNAAGMESILQKDKVMNQLIKNDCTLLQSLKIVQMKPHKFDREDPRMKYALACLQMERAVNYVHAGEMELAWQDATACIDLGKTDVHAIMGETLHQMNRFDDAETAFSDGLTANPLEITSRAGLEDVRESKNVASAIGTNIAKLWDLLSKDREMRRWIQEDETFAKILKDVQANPYSFGQISDTYVQKAEKALKILENASIALARGPPITSLETLAAHVSKFRTFPFP
ncbi:Aste57867_23918 [Aphanomyces stellatus]|uniref:Aste57867_23918 protein n=1 Tax=Aphanomyces stellatus TaxID=120398 RepID=A0A485LTF0_9STRA|nr:hypothetical protein As57867_023845 [Aphanomyces stellatus]VFU00561.1 Aste57867_23918 [Aphanomyces stellatus]